jgi:hypothetical protein
VNRDRYRTIGALLGLAAGWGLMRGLGLSGIAVAAVFGAGGCVAGAIAAEKVYAWNQRGSR